MWKWFLAVFAILAVFCGGGMFFLFGAIFRAARWGGKGHGHGPGGPWNDEGRQRFEERAREWHEREHGGGDVPPTPTTAA